MHRLFKKIRQEHGMTLIELMVYLLIVVVVGASLGNVIQTSMIHYQNEQARMELRQEVQAALDLIVKDVRMAGCDPSPEDATKFGFFIAQPQSMRFISDVWPLMGQVTVIDGVEKPRIHMGDNKSTGPGEDVHYFFDTNQLMRRARHDDLQMHTEVVLENVTDLQFDYYSTPGVPVVLAGVPPVGGVFFIEITLEAESRYVDRNTQENISFRANTTVHLRNMKFRSAGI